MTTNTQYHVKEYKGKDYGPIKEYKLKNKPKYHEYKSYHEYGKIKQYEKIRNYEYREYKAKKPSYHGYKPEARPPKPEKERLLPKRERQYNRQKWFRQLKHCYKLPMGPEYPIKTYKTREYKRKKQQLDYHEYKGYKPFKGYGEYKGSVRYPLTELNYYGFRRGKRVYRPITPAAVAPKPDWYPLKPKSEPEYPQQTLIHPVIVEPPKPEPVVYKPLPPAPEIVYPQELLILPKTVEPVVKEKKKEKEVYQPIIRENNGFYHLQHPVGYHGYTSYHEYNSKYRPYQYKEYGNAREYNHLFLYTAKDMPDRKPHIFRQEKEIRHISYPEETAKVAPVAKESVQQVQKMPQTWKRTFAKEVQLKQEILILPREKPEKVQPRKKLPNVKEPVYPSQVLIMQTPKKQPLEVVIAEKVLSQQAKPPPRYVPVKREYVEESQILTLPTATKKQKYIPTKKKYVVESVTVIAPKSKSPAIKPVQIIEDVSETKPIVVPLVAMAESAPPPSKSKYQPTSIKYVEDSVIVTIPKKYRVEELKKEEVKKQKSVPPPVKKVNQGVQTKPMTPLPQPKPVIQSLEPQNKPTPIVVPIVAAASKKQESKEKAQSPPVETVVIPPPAAVSVPEPEKPKTETVDVVFSPNVAPVVAAKPPVREKDSPEKKVVIVPTATIQTNPSSPTKELKKQSTPESKPSPAKELESEPEQTPKPKPVIAPSFGIPKPQEPEPKKPTEEQKPTAFEKPKPAPVEAPKPIQQKEPHQIEAPKPFTEKKPEPVETTRLNAAEEKAEPLPPPIFRPLPVKPPQPRQAPPKSKPQTKSVQRKTETQPEPERPETPRTPPKLRTGIRKASIPRAASPPLEIPRPQVPAKKQKPSPQPEVSATATSLAVPGLGALGSVKRTFHMMG